MAIENSFPQGNYRFREVDGGYFSQISAGMARPRGIATGFMAVLYNGEVAFLCGVSTWMNWDIKYGWGGVYTKAGQLEWNMDAEENSLEIRCEEETVITGSFGGATCSPGWTIKYYVFM